MDQNSIESILVCSSQDLAKSLTTRRENVPANVSYVLSHDFNRFFPPRGETGYRSYYMEPLQGSGMLRSTVTNLLQERRLEMEGLNAHLKDLQRELQELVKSKASYEAERRRFLGEIQKQRGVIAQVNSKLSMIKAEEDSEVNDSENIRAKIATRNTELTCSEEKIQETLTQRDMLTDLINEKDELLRSSKKELSLLKNATQPVQKQLRDNENVINSRTKEILNQEKLIKKLNTEQDNLQ